MQEGPLCQGNLLPDWKNGLTTRNFYKEPFDDFDYVRSY